jgi:hypothetical protein
MSLIGTNRTSRDVRRSVAPAAQRCGKFDTTGKSFSDNRKLIVCPALTAKIFCFSEIESRSRMLPILTRQEGRFANVSNVGQVAVDVGGSFDDWSSLRTAKPWGPDTPTLVSSLRDAIPGSDGG